MVVRVTGSEAPMICNIIDSRNRPYRWKKVNAIIEATWHDNSCQDSDLAEAGEDDVVYEQRTGISVSEAVAWATAEASLVTLYLYDEGAGVV